jgi:hypothetical protein
MVIPEPANDPTRVRGEAEGTVDLILSTVPICGKPPEDAWGVASKTLAHSRT